MFRSSTYGALPLYQSRTVRESSSSPCLLRLLFFKRSSTAPTKKILFDATTPRHPHRWYRAVFSSNMIASVATSSPKTIKRILKKHNLEDENVVIHSVPFEFYDEMEDYETPFPCNKYWDKKGWWFAEHSKLKGRTLFWNIGA